MKIMHLYETVEGLLESDPKYRDSDYMLLARIWYNQAGCSEEMKLNTFLREFARGEYYHPESIVRARRKVQEDSPHLRGKLYAKRRAEQKSVKEELGYQSKLFKY